MFATATSRPLTSNAATSPFPGTSPSPVLTNSATPVSCRARAHPLIRGQRFDNIHATRRRETSSAGFPTREGGQPMAYTLEGQLLEVCTCNILCPCWVGEDPDGGTCD